MPLCQALLQHFKVIEGKSEAQIRYVRDPKVARLVTSEGKIMPFTLRPVLPQQQKLPVRPYLTVLTLQSQTLYRFHSFIQAKRRKCLTNGIIYYGEENFNFKIKFSYR